MFFGNTAAYRGGAIISTGCTPVVINNSIIRNRCTVSSSSATGGGILALSGAAVSGGNNIVWDNTSYTNPNIGGTVNFTYSNVQGGLTGTGNINSNPFFVHNPPNGWFFLAQTAAGQNRNSPCMNAGNPASSMIIGSTRTDLIQDAGVVDMGFHWWLAADQMPGLNLRLDDDPELQQPIEGTVVPQSMDLGIENHPNPFNPATTVTLWLDQAAPVDLTVYDAAGRMVERLFQGDLAAGSHDFLFSGMSLPAGVYVYRADCGGRIATGKALLIK